MTATGSICGPRSVYISGFSPRAETRPTAWHDWLIRHIVRAIIIERSSAPCLSGPSHTGGQGRALDAAQMVLLRDVRFPALRRAAAEVSRVWGNSSHPVAGRPTSALMARRAVTSGSSVGRRWPICSEPCM